MAAGHAPAQGAGQASTRPQPAPSTSEIHLPRAPPCPPLPQASLSPLAQEWLPPTAPATWQPWQRDPAAPHFPFHQYIQAKHAADRAVGPDPDMEMQRQIASAAAIMVGQEVHELNAALRHRMYADFTPWKRQEPGVKPRIRGALYCGPRGGGGVCSKTRRVMAVTLQLQGVQHHDGAARGAPAAH